MRLKEQRLSASEARRLLRYDPETGVLIWEPRTPEMFEASLLRSSDHVCALWNSKHAGKQAGHLSPLSGYVVVRLGGFLYFAQRLAWLLMTGAWPPATVDHRNRDTADNTWANLRSATQMENCRNQMKKKKGAVGLKGVTRRLNGRYVAQIQTGERVQNLGTYDCPAAAHLAYVVAADRYHGEFARVA